MKSKIGFALMGLAMLASCAQENEIEVVADGQDIITLGASAQGVDTRAVINDLAALSAEGTKVGIYAVATSATKPADVLTADWTAAPLMKDVQTKAIDNTSGMMSWVNPEAYIYPKTGDKLNVKFMAYYPYAAEGSTGDNFVTAAGVSTSPKLNFTLTGQEDLMWATPVIGSRTTPASALKFNHKLTQFTFQLKDSKGTFSTTNGAINAVTVNANTKGVMDLETGAIANWGTPADINVLGSAIATVPTNTPVALNTITMLQAAQGSFGVTLKYDGIGEPKVPGSKTATIKPVGDATFLAGKAYLITLGLAGDVLVQLSAEVVPWTTGGVGEGTVE